LEQHALRNLVSHHNVTPGVGGGFIVAHGEGVHDGLPDLGGEGVGQLRRPRAYFARRVLVVIHDLGDISIEYIAVKLARMVFRIARSDDGLGNLFTVLIHKAFDDSIDCAIVKCRTVPVRQIVADGRLNDVSIGPMVWYQVIIGVHARRHIFGGKCALQDTVDERHHLGADDGLFGPEGAVWIAHHPAALCCGVDIWGGPIAALYV